MSNHLTSLAYRVNVGSLLRKSVLILLADKASDDGSGIWASKQTMADELCCSKQAVLKTIQEFIDEGLLSEAGQKKHRNGYTVTYALNVAAINRLPRVKRWADNQSIVPTGQCDEPVNEEPFTGQPGLPKPSKNPPSEAKASYLKGTALPDWVPTEPWMAFVRMRKAMRNVPFLEDAARGQFRALKKLRDEGYCPEKTLWMAVDRGWRGLFANDANRATDAKREMAAGDWEKIAANYEKLGMPDSAKEARMKARAAA